MKQISLVLYDTTHADITPPYLYDEKPHIDNNYTSLEVY